MDKSELKQLLKSARELINAKDYKLALRECEAILKADPKQFMALLFSGVCLTELNDSIEARKSYEKAISIDDKQISGWQGFCQFYEKFYIYDENYCSCLRKVLQLSSDLSKKIDIRLKLSKCLAKIGKLSDAIAELSELEKSVNIETEKFKVCQNLVELIDGHVLTSIEEISLVSQSYKTLIDNSINENRVDYEEKFAKFLLHHNQKEEALKIIEKALAENVNLSSSLKITFGQMIFRKFITEFELSDEELDLIETVLEKSINNDDVINKNDNFNLKIVNFSLDFISACCNGAICEAIGCFEDLKDEEFKTRLEILTLGVIGYSLLLDYNNSIILAEKVLRICDYNQSSQNSQINLRIQYEKSLARIFLARQNGDDRQLLIPDLEKLLNTLQSKNLEILASKCEVLKLFGLCQNGNEFTMKIDQKDTLKLEFEFLKAELWFEETNVDFLTICAKNCEKLDEDNFKSLLVSSKENFLRLQSGEPIEAILVKNLFQKVAKSNERSWEAFFYLSKLSTTSQIALRCMEKAYELNSTHPDTVKGLFELYNQHTNQSIDQKIDLLEKFIENRLINQKNLFHFENLADLYKIENRLDEAAGIYQKIISFEKCKRLESWFKLGKVYHLKGSHVSALKALEKCIEIDRCNVAVLFQVVLLQRQLKMIDEAKKVLQRILEILNSKTTLQSSQKIAVSFTLAETLFLQANSTFSSGRYFEALDYCIESCTLLKHTLQHTEKSAAMFKLFGDILAFCCCKFPEEKLDKLAESLGILDNDKTKRLMLIASLLYAKSIKLQPDIPEVYCSLGQLLLQRYLIDKKDVNLAERAEATVRRAIELKPDYSPYWSVLGVIGTSYRTPTPENQHHVQNCFVEALRLDKLNAEAWTNLGLFYLASFPNLEIAQECFKKAQIADPVYCKAWLGQALIAERLGHQKDSMDLFRHATTLSLNPQAMLSYAYHVVAMLMDENIQNLFTMDEMAYCRQSLHCATVASDAIVKYLDLNPKDTVAWNLSGVLHEHQNLLANAEKDFLRSNLLVAKDDDLPKSDKVYAKMNLMRIYGKLFKFEKAQMVWDEISKIVKDPNFTLNALISFQAGNFANALENYDYSLYYTKLPEDSFYTAISQCLILLLQKSHNEALKFFVEKIGHVEERILARVVLLILKISNGKVDLKLVKECFNKFLEQKGTFSLVNLEKIVCRLLEMSKLIETNMALWIIQKFPYLTQPWIILARCKLETKLRDKLERRISAFEPIDSLDQSARSEFCLSYGSKRDLCKMVYLQPDLLNGVLRKLELM